MICHVANENELQMGEDKELQTFRIVGLKHHLQGVDCIVQYFCLNSGSVVSCVYAVFLFYSVKLCT